VFYLATRPDAIYVLHAFEKKTQKTSAHDLRIGRDRFSYHTEPPLPFCFAAHVLAKVLVCEAH
jgi:hypothetical protein